METFIGKLASYYTKTINNGISNYCFVFPSRRAALFFKQELSVKISRPVWAPRIVTINEFFSEVEKTPVADPVTLLFKLHLCYKEVTGSSIAIDEFVPVGEMLLGDFNDIDKYLANPVHLFANLSDIKALAADFSYLQPEQVEAIRSFWSSFDPVKLSAQQQDFLAVWEKLPEVYNLFRGRLREQGIAYDGMIARGVADKVRSGDLVVPYQKVVFAGFNALNNCERLLFNHLKLLSKADFFWDVPRLPGLIEHRLAFVPHEATRFIKPNLDDFPPPADWVAPANNALPDITISAAPNNLAQARVAHDYLKDTHAGVANPEKVALVLCDEMQLLPTLHNIPELYGAVNITLGYPVKNTPAASLVENLLLIQKSARAGRDGNTWFYSRHLLDLLHHQYMETLTGGLNRQLMMEITGSKKMFVERKSISRNGILERIFIKINGSAQLGSYITGLLDLVYSKLTGIPENAIEREFVFFLHKAVKQLSEVLSGLEQEPAITTWYSLFKKVVLQQTIPFRGEPLSGLQVMGILETRLLDFEHLVITGLNEGIYPRAVPPVSFIPFNLRRGHGLPTLDNQDAIYAYYFYRLIDRAKSVKLLYTTARAASEEVEMSRYLQQLYFEYPGKVKIETRRQEVNVPGEKSLVATKNELVKMELERWISRGDHYLTPSALSAYLECPLKFYYGYVARIKEPDEIDDELDPRAFGNLFHQVAEKIYRPFVGMEVGQDQIEGIKKNEEALKRVINSAFAPVNNPQIFDSLISKEFHGKISLVQEIILKYIKEFLNRESMIAPFKLIALEQRVFCRFVVNDNLTVNLGGIIDRVDQLNGHTRVVDYKTGAVKLSIDNIDKLFDQKYHPENKAIFQTLLYSLVKRLSDNIPSNLLPAIVEVKKIFNGNYDNNLYFAAPKQGAKVVLTLDLVHEDFARGLRTVLEELFNPLVPFEQTRYRKTCTNCLYKHHCFV